MNMQSSDENTANNLPPSHHQQIVLDNDEYSSSTGRLMFSPTLSSSSSGPLLPKADIAKPARRRTRASKKAPMTLLNASPNNFRALVQQFTGCHTAPIAAGWKGPINLNFAQYSYYSDLKYEPDQVQQQRQHRQNPRDEDSGPSFSSPISSNDVAAAAATATGDHEMMFAAAAVNSSRPGPMSNLEDDLDMEIFPVREQQPVDPGDYYSASTEIWHDDFWGPSD